jgi:hypothetical protein
VTSSIEMIMIEAAGWMLANELEAKFNTDTCG